MLEYKETKPKKFNINYTSIGKEATLFFSEVAISLLKQKDFIFINEATVQPHECNTKKWQLTNSKLIVPTQSRMPSIKMIAAMNHRGIILYQLSEENTNQSMLLNF